MSFPWKRDAKLLAEAKELEGYLYENEAIYMFGFQLGKLYKDIELEHLHLYFRSPNRFPDAVLFRDDTEEVLDIEFETVSKNFEEHRHEAKKCDLVVCHFHNKDWKNPISVYELTSGKFYPPKDDRPIDLRNTMPHKFRKERVGSP